LATDFNTYQIQYYGETSVVEAFLSSVNVTGCDGKT